MIIALCIWDGKTERFKTLEEAEKKTCISRKRICRLIKTGGKWKGWTFDVDSDESFEQELKNEERL